MTASLPPRAEVLAGRAVRLEPLSIEALRELAPKLRTPEVFAGGFGGGPAAMTDTDEDFVEYFADYCPMGRGGRSYVVRREDGTAVGTTSFYDFDVASESVAIGFTAYAPEVWGTVVNPDAKRTLLETAFGRGVVRVIFHVDGRNEHSRAAMTKLGAHLDGILRRDRLRADGTWRDTAIFTILADEWPEVRAGLDARIDAHLAAD